MSVNFSTTKFRFLKPIAWLLVLFRTGRLAQSVELQFSVLHLGDQRRTDTRSRPYLAGSNISQFYEGHSQRQIRQQESSRWVRHLALSGQELTYWLEAGHTPVELVVASSEDLYLPTLFQTARHRHLADEE